MRFGICCGPCIFAPQVEGQPLSAIPRLMQTLQAADADYVEFGVAAVAPDSPEDEFDRLKEAMAPYPIRVEAFNSFIPASYRITGPDAHLARSLEYCRTALRRCKDLGAEVVVLGSAGARKAPQGFEHARAERQFIEFCRALGPIAENSAIDIAIEPLNSKEDNLLLSVEHGARLVDEIDHPRIQLLADLYHMSEEKEPLEHVARAGSRLRHAHCADLGRVPPGFSESGEEDFLGFFRNLRRAGYDARCSFEGSFTNIETQAKHLLDHLRRRWEESAS